MSGLFGFSPRKKAIFFRQLATMVHAAVSLDRAVSTAGVGTLPQSIPMARAIVAGRSLSQSMEAYPGLFNEYEVQIVRLGETSGSLDRQLEVLAVEQERGYQLRQSLMSKLFYPLLVAHMAVFIPPLVLLVQHGPESYFRMTLGTLIPIYLVGLIGWVLYRAGGALGPGRQLMDSLFAWIPILGAVLRLLALTRFLRTLAHLLEAGTLPYQALQVSARCCGNSRVRARLDGAYRKLGQDRKVSEWMQVSGLFSLTVLSLVASGEESGRVGELVAKAAELVESEYREKLHLVMTVLPVLMLLAVGLLVGVRVFSMVRGYVQMLNL